MPIVQTQAATVATLVQRSRRSSKVLDRAVQLETNSYLNRSTGLIWPDARESLPEDGIILSWNGLMPDLMPDHTQLPAEDGTFVKNFQEHPQSILLTDSMRPVLQGLHPDGQYAIGQDCGIYWRLPSPPEELVKGAEAPDWFYVPGVPPLLDGEVRRSYVMWREQITPLIVMEFVSGNGEEERDKTPVTGKFWVYEQAIKVPFYAIYEVKKARVELYRLNNQGSYELVPANERGHYPVRPLGIELGIWKGLYDNQKLPWVRCWDSDGNLLLTGEERANKERQRANKERQRAEEAELRAQEAAKQAQEERLRAQEAAKQAQEQRLRAKEAEERAKRLAAQLRALGLDPENFS
jgi:Uma2 family endonuclease